MLVATRGRALTGLGVVGILAALVVFALLDSDVPEVFGDAWRLAFDLARSHGYFSVVGFLYLEESGVPLPVPGDVFVMYLGERAAHTAGLWAAAWLAIVIVVVLGASNLYLIARRWGPALVRGRLGKLLHLTPKRLTWAEGWYQRWGPWALIVGRHIPGGRVPMTLAAGLFGMRYPVFFASVAASTAVWAAIFLVVGSRVGPYVRELLQVHRGTYLALPAVVAVAGVGYVVHRLLDRRVDTRSRANPPSPR